jgi:hypothetical protein
MVKKLQILLAIDQNISLLAKMAKESISLQL